jgi:hypothetical protein
MKKLINVALLFVFPLLGGAGVGLAQNCDKGCCTLNKTTPDATIPAGKAKLHVFFKGPDGRPVKSRVKFLLGKDTLNPKINAKGIYQIYVRPDAYKMKFKAPWWYVVKQENVVVKAGNAYFLTVKFEAKEIFGKGKDGWD